MNLLFLIPSLGYGLYLFLSSGSAVLLVLSGLTIGVWSLVSSQRRFDLSSEVIIREGRLYLGDRRLNQFPWTWSRGVRDVVYPALFPDRQPELNLGELPIWAIGMLATGEPIRSPLSPLSPHAIIIGQTGSGKTELLKRLINAFEGNVILIDFKGGFDFAHLARPLCLITKSEVEQVLEILEQRMSQPGVPILVVVDELAEALRHPKLCQILESVATKGRSLGMHFVGATQTMTGVPRSIWTNCHSRFALRADQIDRAQLALPVKALAPEILGYAELQNGTLRGFFFPCESRETPDQKPANPLLPREDSKPWSKPSEGFAPFRQTPLAPL